MGISPHRSFDGHNFSLVVTLIGLMLPGVEASAQCPVTPLIAGLQVPLGITQSNEGNLLVAEIGIATNTGRISIVDLDGDRRTLLAGLPSNPGAEPSGPNGLFMRGRTLYLVIGGGNATLPGPLPGTLIPNPTPASPLFSSVLAIHFSADAEKTTTGFTLTPADHQALASGDRVTLSNGGGDRVTIELIANFPDFIPEPLASFPANVRNSNPFHLVVVGNQLYVTDGGQNLVWQADITTGTFSVLAAFPAVPNPLFNPTPPPPSLGGPFVEAVPTGIAHSDGQLLVTLFRGFPFPSATSVVEQVDPSTGNHIPFVTGLKTAIDVLPIREGKDTDYLVLQHASGPILSGLGLLSSVETSGGSPTVIANCLNRPTAMVLDEKTRTLYVTELVAGRIVAIALAP